MATLMGSQPDSWRIGHGTFALDLPAGLIIVLLSLLLARGTRESARFNIVVTGG